MKKSIFNIAIASLVLLSAGAKSQSISYTYVKNDPFDTKNFSLAIDPLFFDINGHNTTKKDGMGYAFGWGIRAEHMMGKTLLFNVDSRFGFGTNGYRKSNSNTRNYFNFEGGLGLILSNKTKSRNLGIILSQSTSGNTRTTVYIKGGVPAKIRRIVAFRAGFQQYTNTLGFDSKNLADSLLKFSAHGTTYTYKEATDDKAKTSVFKDTVNKVGGTALSIDKLGGIAITSLYAGFQFRKIHNLVIDVDGYGYRSNVTYSDFYIDVMFAPVIALKDFKNSDGTTYSVKYDQMSHFGWRMGWFVRQPKEQGFSMKFEFGSRPGFKALGNKDLPLNLKNMYCMFTFGLYIPLKLKPIYMGE